MKHAQTHTHMRIYTHMHTHRHTHTQTERHTHTHTHMHMHTHTHKHTHTHLQTLLLLLLLSYNGKLQITFSMACEILTRYFLCLAAMMKSGTGCGVLCSNWWCVPGRLHRFCQLWTQWQWTLSLTWSVSVTIAMRCQTLPQSWAGGH